MRYFVTIDTDNAAFGDYPATEVARILRELADSVDDYTLGDKRSNTFQFPVHDVNGNRVGTHGYNRTGRAK